jgi:subtilisin-like proprotein convertase family protein
MAALTVLALAAAPASADTQTLFNPTSLTIPSSGTASLYPSRIDVNGLTGPVTDVNLSLYRFGHTRPRDVQVLLVSPGGHKVMVMASNCGEDDIEDFSWLFAQQVLTIMPSSLDNESCGASAYRPNAFVSNASLPDPAPRRPYVKDLDAFNGENPNGLWKLYVADPFPTNSGDVEGGWALTLTTGPVDTRIPASSTRTSGIAGPYGTTREVSGADRVITDLDVVVSGVWHQRPSDLDLLLEGPHGQSVVLMSDACGDTDLAGKNFVFDDESFAMPVGDGTCGSTRYHPTDYDFGDSWPFPAPGSNQASLSAFDATDPNGEWRLYTTDDADGATGFFTRHFDLRMETRPKAEVEFSEEAVTVAEGTARELSLKRSGSASLGLGSVTLSSGPVSPTTPDDFTPVSKTVVFRAGETEKTVKVDALADAADEPDETYAVFIASATGDARAGSAASVVVTIPAPRPDDGGSGGGGGTTGGGTTGGGTTGGGTTGGGAGPLDTLAPVLTNAGLNPPRFRVGRAGTALRFSSTEAGTLSVTFERARPGRRRTAHATCRLVKRRPKRGACTTYRRAGSLTQAIGVGDGAVALTGRLGNRRLAPGRYRLALVATDAAGNRSKPVRLKLTIVR